MHEHIPPAIPIIVRIFLTNKEIAHEIRGMKILNSMFIIVDIWLCEMYLISSFIFDIKEMILN